MSQNENRVDDHLKPHFHASAKSYRNYYKSLNTTTRKFFANRHHLTQFMTQTLPIGNHVKAFLSFYYSD